MKNRNFWKKIGYLFVASMAIVLLVFFGGIGLLPTIHLWVGAAEDIAPWQLLEGVSGLVSVALIVGGSVFALVEYSRSEIEQERKDQEQKFLTYQALFERLKRSEEVTARRWIIQKIELPEPDPENAKWTVEDWDRWILETRATIFAKAPGHENEMAPGHAAIKCTLESFDNLGFTVLHYWELNDDLMKWMNPMIVKVWERIGPYIEEEASRRNEPHYYENAREFGDDCIQWRKDHGIKDPTYVDFAL